jgi:hypothetical protein
MHFDVFSYIYDSCLIKFLEPKQYFKPKMDSEFPDGFTDPS